ncbi:MAG: gamma-glutamyltransferase [Deltaproteobacteria bacterium]|nr:gamma-glutamyltransferase [Deltaproteobacteria bacterium]
MKKIFPVLLSLACFAGPAPAAPVGPINEAYANKGMVSSSHELASRAGVEIMQKGGNAVDAAVATALALNVVEPYNCGLGGGGFTMIRFAKTGEVVFLDYREKAPAAATKDMFSSERAKAEAWSRNGGKAVAVPAFLLGMWEALKKYGAMSFAEVAGPAIRLAEEGFVLRPGQREQFEEAFPFLLKYNNPAELPYLKDGRPLVPGDELKQPKLADALRLIAKKGPKVFYEGEIGKAIVAAVQKSGGNMTMDDLKTATVEFRAPVEGVYRSHKIYSAPPASSGGTHVLQILNVMENFDPKVLKHNSAEYLNALGQTMRLVFADRDKYMADTAFVKAPLAGLVSKDYAKTLFKRINPKGKIMEKGVAGDPWSFDGGARSDHKGGLGDEHHSTAHFSVVDAEGNIVASTNTINFWFGARVMAPEYQFLLNNQMDDFSSDPTSVNAPEPGKRPLSSMSPTIVLAPDGKPYMTLGCAGFLRIIAGVAQIVMNAVDHGMNMDEAIQQPRIWTGASGPSRVEKSFDEAELKRLEAYGHQLDHDQVGICQGILLRDGKINGGAESTRSSGMAVGF